MVNISGLMKESLCANSTPAKPVTAADGNDFALGARCDSVDTRRGLAVADRDKGAACRRAQQVERADNRQDQHGETGEIERRAVARHGNAEQGHGLDPHAFYGRFLQRQNLLELLQRRPLDDERMRPQRCSAGKLIEA